MDNKKIKQNKIIKVTALLGLFLLVFGISYALFSVVLEGTKKNKISTGTLSLKLTDLEGNEETEGYGINLENAYPMTNEEGLEQTSYEFKIINDGTIDAYYKLKIEALETTDLPVSTIRYNLVEDGEPITIEPKLLSNTTTTKKTSNNNNLYQIDTDIIKVGEEKTYKLNIWIDYAATIEQAANKTFEGKLEIEGSQITSTTNVFKEGTVAYTTYQNETIQGRSNKTKLLKVFNSTTETSGLYTYPDMDGGTTYYYRGTEVNNYVSFAGKTWRIVRVLEDGSVRLILEDRIDEKGYKYNSQYDDPSYVKYSTSEIKTTVDNWYNTNLLNYDKYITTSTYCSDTREDSENTMAKYFISSGATKVYGIYARGTLDTEFDENADHTDEEVMAWFDSFAFKPDLSCREEDKVESKAALLSADEYVLAGGGVALTVNNYLVKADYLWWTMSPAEFTGNANVNSVNSDSLLDLNDVNNLSAVRPVITLKATTTISSGSGTSADPYVIG